MSKPALERTASRALIGALVLLAGACAGTTPVRDLALPPVTAIEGTVTRLEGEGFTLTDGSGSIFVRAKLPEGRGLGLSPGERVRVFGNLQGGPERVFDGYVIRKPTGEQIIVTRPSPHFGFVLQMRAMRLRSRAQLGLT
jgi:hypothetical protein